MLHTQLWEQLATVDSLLRLALLQSLHIQISGDGCWFALDGLLDRYKALGANFPTRTASRGPTKHPADSS